jgi:hypothetical protein
MINIPITTKVSKVKDEDNCYYFALSIFDLFSIQDISSLNIGDKIKSYNLKYNNEIVKFTISSIDTTNGVITLISDVLNTNKEYDASESAYINGNPDWNLSNIKQWLNSDEKIG